MAPLKLSLYYRVCYWWPGVVVTCLLLVLSTVGVTLALLPKTGISSPPVVLPAASKVVVYEAKDPRVAQVVAPYSLSQAEATRLLLQIMQRQAAMGEGVHFSTPQSDYLEAQGELVVPYAVWNHAMAALSQKLPLTQLRSVTMQQQEGAIGVYQIHYQLALPVRQESR